MNGLTSEILSAILWLGCPNQSRELITGSGVIVHHKNQEYLATARHVVAECGFNPLVRYRERWNHDKWSLVSEDATLDIAVLKSDETLTQLTPRYGMAHVHYGALGRALGFPDVSLGLSGTGEINGRPLPMPVVVTVGGTMFGDIQYTGGYVNSGYSGGAIVYPVEHKHWTIVGIITERGGTVKQWQGKPVVEPTGMVRFTSINAVIREIDRAEHP